jgi:hypothetical protein
MLRNRGDFRVLRRPPRRGAPRRCRRRGVCPRASGSPRAEPGHAFGPPGSDRVRPVPSPRRPVCLAGRAARVTVVGGAVTRAPGPRRRLEGRAGVPTGTGRVLPGTGDVPAGTHDVPAGTGHVPAGTRDAPAGTGRVPAGTHDVPAGTGRVLAGTHDVPAGTGHVPAGTRDVPAGTGRVPAGTRDVPPGTGHLPAGTRDVPSGTGRVPAGTREGGARDVRTDRGGCSRPTGRFGMGPEQFHARTDAAKWSPRYAMAREMVAWIDERGVNWCHSPYVCERCLS